jgi:hypothetical protein
MIPVHIYAGLKAHKIYINSAHSMLGITEIKVVTVRMLI